jgi:hypothetical protein
MPKEIVYGSVRIEERQKALSRSLGTKWRPSRTSQLVTQLILCSLIDWSEDGLSLSMEVHGYYDRRGISDISICVERATKPDETKACNATDS